MYTLTEAQEVAETGLKYFSLPQKLAPGEQRFMFQPIYWLRQPDNNIFYHDMIMLSGSNYLKHM